MAKKRNRWNGAEQMQQAILHPAVWQTLMARRGRRRGKGWWSKSKKGRKSAPMLCDTTENNREGQLVPEIWKDFPEELIDRVLGRLPFNRLVACRSVCKRWNAYILSTRPPLAPASNTTLVHFPPCGDFRHEPLVVYNAKSNCWEKLSLSFLADGGVLGLHSLAAADGGLLCFYDLSWTKLLVCNPVSKQWRHLQPPSSVLPRAPGMQMVGSAGDYILVGMVVNGDNGSYKLVLAGLKPRMTSACRTRRKTNEEKEIKCTRTTFVYNSYSRSWSEAPTMPLSPELECGVWSNECPRRSVVINGKLCWSIVERDEEDDNSMREVVTFDIERSEWCKAEVDHDVRDLVALDGKAYIVKLRDGVRLRFQHNQLYGGRWVYRGVESEICPSVWDSRVFEVQDAGPGICIRRKSIPRALRDLKRRDEVTSKYDNQYGCVGQGTSLFVMHQVIDGDFSGGWEMQGWSVLHFDSSTNSCVWLPQFDTYIHEKYPSSWWTLQPSLTALV